mmetsp:Transcript_18554/g.40378  ORF Transcript_18554/g.40378 Transcript_18554/m.40378 type:complete len:88 (+) Transcript_18554:723-986(+)
MLIMELPLLPLSRHLERWSLPPCLRGSPATVMMSQPVRHHDVKTLTITIVVGHDGNDYEASRKGYERIERESIPNTASSARSALTST